MRIIPVIDLMGGAAVRGRAGRRSEYRPLVGGAANSSDPLAVADAFRDRFGLSELYIADLDAIAGAAPDVRLHSQIVARGLTVMVDAGVADPDRALSLRACGLTVIAGLETVPGAAVLAEIVDRIGTSPDGNRPIVFSLDLRAGSPMRLWPGVPADADSIAAAALDAGVDRILILDVARVGVGGGTGTDDLCRRLRRDPRVRELIVGGGVAGVDDLSRLRDGGADAVLVASALHDGRLTPADCLNFRE